MKIKYFDKGHKKISQEAKENIISITAGLIISGIVFGSAFALAENSKQYPQRNDIYNVSYIHEDKSYNLSDIYILYNNNEIRKCIRRAYVSSEGLLDPNYDYEFYDLETREILGYTKYDSMESNADNPEHTLNGYKYINLGKLMYDDFYEKKNNNTDEITQNVIEQTIVSKVR